MILLLGLALLKVRLHNVLLYLLLLLFIIIIVVILFDRLELVPINIVVAIVIRVKSELLSHRLLWSLH